MEFEKLEDRMLYYRSITDYKVKQKSYVMVMLDGKNFSSKIKKKYKLPFDQEFINIMNDTAAYVCSQVQGAKLAYVQSDEISIVLTDFDNNDTDCYYGYRLTKMLSIIASIATSFFNKAVITNLINNATDKGNLLDMMNKESLYQFDCKVWNVPTYNDVFAWFLYRQNDCIKNSKGQAAQTYLSHNELLGKTCDEQIQMLLNIHNIDWNAYCDGMKFGRFIYKKTVPCTKIINDKELHFNRSIWYAFDAFKLSDKNGKQTFENMFTIPQK